MPTTLQIPYTNGLRPLGVIAATFVACENRDEIGWVPALRFASADRALQPRRPGRERISGSGQRSNARVVMDVVAPL